MNVCAVQTSPEHILVHWTVHMRSDRKSCVTDDKKEVKEKLNTLCHLLTADLSLHEVSGRVSLF